MGRKFTIFALFNLVFESKFQVQAPTGEAYIRRGDLTEGFLRYDFGGLIFGGAYTWKGLFSEFYGTFHKRGFALSVFFKVRVFGTREWVKWPIQWCMDSTNYAVYSHRGCRSGTRAAQWWKHSPPTNVRLNPTFNAPSDPTFESWKRRHTWVYFAVLLPLRWQVFIRVQRLSPLLKNKPKHQKLNQECRRRTPLWGSFPSEALVIYLFICLFI